MNIQHSSTSSRPSLRVYLGSILFWAGMGTSTILFTTLGWLILLPLDFAKRYRLMSQWTRFNIWWLKLTCRLDCEVKGLKYLDNIPGAAIVMSNHQSTWETLAIQRFIPPQVWVLKRELMRIPFFGWGMAMMHPIAIDRKAGKKSIEQLINQGRERLARGLWVVVFPQGTRVAPSTKVRYKIGGAALAARTGAWVVPVAHNSGRYWPAKGFLIYPGKICLEFGPPIDPTDKKPEQILECVHHWIETRLEQLEGAHTGTEEKLNEV